MAWYGGTVSVLTASNPSLFRHPTLPGNLLTSNTPVSSLPSLAATINGVSKSLLRLTSPSASCPSSIRNSTMAVNPHFAARCSDVLDLSAQSGLRR